VPRDYEKKNKAYKVKKEETGACDTQYEGNQVFKKCSANITKVP